MHVIAETGCLLATYVVAECMQDFNDAALLRLVFSLTGLRRLSLSRAPITDASLLPIGLVVASN